MPSYFTFRYLVWKSIKKYCELGTSVSVNYLMRVHLTYYFQTWRTMKMDSKPLPMLEPKSVGTGEFNQKSSYCRFCVYLTVCTISVSRFRDTSFSANWNFKSFWVGSFLKTGFHKSREACSIFDWTFSAFSFGPFYWLLNFLSISSSSHLLIRYAEFVLGLHLGNLMVVSF